MNQTIRQAITIAIILLILSGISIAASNYARKLPSPAQKALGIKTTKVISYKGEEGKTVLELLKRDHQVDVEESEYGVVVHTIDGTAQTDSAIWVYYVDGTPAAEAADKAVTKNGQNIEWKYENF